MNILSICLVALGLIFLSQSLRPAIKICKKVRSLGWQLLLLLIVFFFIGYCSFLYYLANITTVSIVEICLSTILFGGSVFVFMVINFSLSSIEALHLVAQQERHNALHDSLTGLPNRQHFMQSVTAKVTAAAPFSVFVLDLNDFKQINDAVGHYYGDQLLIQLSKRLAQALPKDCFFSRVGGDEFVLLFDSVEDAEIIKLMGTVDNALLEPFNLDSYNFNVRLSTGVSLFPHDSGEIAPLLRKADTAMYEAKKQRVSYRLYNDALDNDAKTRLAISSKLQLALAESQFEIYYQPVLKLKATKNHHFEALLRWPQADGSFIPPDQFIPLAEQNGSIRQVTLWVLDRICIHLAYFARKDIDACIHINLSALDLQDDRFATHLADLVCEGRLSPTQLVLEVTETAIMADVAKTREILSKLSRQGFRISLDDFGTGFSSLSILRELPINQIKIDRSFVMAMHNGNTNNAIVRSIIFLAQNLGCSVVAEGVENKAIAEELIQLRCDYLQGYYYCKPLPFAAVFPYCEQQGWKVALQ
ncbi:bifunctional diguanylate cyclase/phosphodiesterase [Moritella sp. F3]|uniref:putative bifunctional diguanylate cyclase/phosphodiesterase n=1 Tax=Moritella sp. F3 TaxID=2718882 RepID=UPI0018E1BC4B|nr:GGDEF domain-containing phosphodiesterase [Moritella sp. F3]GIC77934.1 GGDEF-domain containing protein [Moritella sp. F1]GIC82377.1 GGDEF-domain containing protein [Moritella sp. F3]